jgi:membrane fusion protein, multidrug efflux system
MAQANDRRDIAPTAPPPEAAPSAPLAEVSTAPPADAAKAAITPSSAARRPRGFLVAAGLVAAFVAAYFFIPWLHTVLNTISTDDAYVNGHVTFVAPRVAGQVTRVLVDDNMRVKAGSLLVQLDKEPFEVQVAIKNAAVATATANLAAAQAQARALVGQTRGSRFKLERAIEDVKNQLALLKANVANRKVEQANLELAQADYARYKMLVGKGAVSQQQFDEKKAALDVARNRVRSADETTQQTRASLGLSGNHENPLDVPSDIDQNFSAVRQALADLMQSAAQLGYFPASWDETPQQVVTEFFKQDPGGDLDRIYARIIPNVPAIKQAEARLLEAQNELAKANLDLRYCDITSEIDGVVTRRNVNPGNNVQVGQSLMAVRSLTEIWIDANFKETQLADLRIGQRVRCEVDMYGRRREFEGRITGFTMGTGQTLALLPPQNATGNYVKIVQRLPVRIELTDYDPDKAPLFVGLSVEPFVYFKEPASGPHAGEVLQPLATLPAVSNPAAGSVPPPTKAAESKP